LLHIKCFFLQRERINTGGILNFKFKSSLLIQ
jgi:hypothetical protein